MCHDVPCCAVLCRVMLCCVQPGLVCFDLDNFLEMTQKSGKWQCPGTRNFHSWRQLQVRLAGYTWLLLCGVAVSAGSQRKQCGRSSTAASRPLGA